MKKRYLVYIALMFTMIFASIATTLALVSDEFNKENQIIKFEKVSLCADKHGSLLSVEINNVVGNEQVIFDKSLDNQFLRVNPTSDTAECFIRFKLSYTLGNEELDEQNAEVLTYLNEENSIKKGFVPYNIETNNYGYTYSNGYYYLVTSADEENTLLKVVTNNDNENGFIISEKMNLFVADSDENASQEEKINAIVDLSKVHKIMLKVQVEAIQCLNLGSQVENFEDNFEISNSIINSNNDSQNLEQLFGNVTISIYEKAMYDNSVATKGDGTQARPFLIYNLDDLNELAKDVSEGKTFEGEYFKLAKDIDMSKMTEWTPIGFKHASDASLDLPFMGNFDGNEKRIYNANFNFTMTYMALFGNIANATIENIIIDNSTITASADNCSFIIAIATNSTVTNCQTTETCTITSSKNNVGGIFSNAGNSVVSYCINRASITAYANLGGIANHLGGTISYCINYGNITSKTLNNGGIANTIGSAKISYCKNYGEIFSPSGCSGGISQCIYGSSTANGLCNYGKVYTNNTVTKYKPIAGIFAMTSGGNNVIKNCYNRGSIIISNNTSQYAYWNYCAGIIGQSNDYSTVENCYNAGYLEHSGYVCIFMGGIIGEVCATLNILRNCYAKHSYKISSYYSGRKYYGNLYGRITNSISTNSCPNNSTIPVASKLSSEYIDGPNGYPILKWETEL